MPSHLSAIGFDDIAGEEQLTGFLNRMVPLCQRLRVKEGAYLRWSSPSGAEVWIQTDRSGAVTAMNPHFSGLSRAVVQLAARFLRPGYPPLEGSIHAWMRDGENPAAGEEGAYPLVFDLPNARLCDDAEVPGTATVQIAAFAENIALHESPEAHAAAQQNKEARFAPQSFIPSGLFGGNDDAPTAHAMLSGTVRGARELINDITGRRFFHLEVETYAAQLDAVVDPSIIDRLPRAGEIVQGDFWLSGFLTDFNRRKRGLLSRLLAR